MIDRATRSVLRGRPLAAALLLAPLALALAAPLAAASDLLAFTSAASKQQGTFEAAGVEWTCGGELCAARGPDDVALWPGLCAAFVRQAGAVTAFGTVAERLGAPELARCNEVGAADAAPAAAPPAAAAPAPAAPSTPAPAAPPAPAAAAAPARAPAASAPARPAPAVAAAAREAGGKEFCNFRDDDGDNIVDEGVRLRAWEDRDHDLFGDPGRSWEVCPQELRPGLVVNNYDCDDTDPKRNPARDNC